MTRLLPLAALALLPGCGDWLDMPGTPSTMADVLEVTDLRVVLEGLQWPSDLVVDPQGDLYVLDSRAGQIHVVPASGDQGRTLAVAGSPVGLGYSQGRLWVPHALDASLELIDPVSGERQLFEFPELHDDVRLTDVVSTVQGELLVANHGGPWWVDPASGELELVEHKLPLGTAFLAAAHDKVGVILTDVAQDHALLFEPGGEGSQTIGQWGVWEGCFLHPSGVEIDARRRIFLSDPLLGVVQVFDRDARYLGTLGRGEQLLRLEHPMGIASHLDRVYLADAGSGQVVSVRVDERTRPQSSQEMYERKVPRISLQEGRSTPRSRLEEACASCHDGSVQPAAGIWNSELMHHPVGDVPDKEIPLQFDLDENRQIYCGTCHIPHRMTLGGPELGPEDEEVFLREPRARSRLCLACHPHVVAEARGLELSRDGKLLGHVLGELPGELPRSGAGAIAADVEAVECLDCHAPHGALTDMLLDGEPTAIQGCRRCHEGLAGENEARSHPVGRSVEDADAVEILRARSVFLGSYDEVTCLTCHDVHSSGEGSWLTAAFDAHERCLLCHDKQTSLTGGSHDLRDGPQGHVATACLACHVLHDAGGPSLGRMAGRRGDPSDCLECHGFGGAADAEIDSRAGHPLFEDNPAPGSLPSVTMQGADALGVPGKTGCLSCHDPHADTGLNGNEAMLRLPGSEADGCLACHEDMATAVDSDHDLRWTQSRYADQRRDSMHAGGSCLGCHGMHEKGGWRGLVTPLGGRVSNTPDERVCLGCHQAGNRVGGTVVRVWDHPGDLLLTTAKLPWHNTGELPLYDRSGEATDDTQIGSITCLTCHDPHVWSPKKGGQGGRGEGDTQSSFLRDGWEGFCSGCHGEEALSAYRYFHDSSHRAELRKQNERRQWPIYGEGGE